MQKIVLDSAQGGSNKALYLWSDVPRFEVSTAPLADKEGQALQLPDAPWFDHALFLSDQQVQPPPLLPLLPCTPLPSPQVSRCTIETFI